MCFRNTFRFADDLNGLDNPFLPHLLYRNQTYLGIPGIYPTDLTLTSSARSTPDTPVVPFLSFTIAAFATSEPGHLVYHLAPYDKRDSPAFGNLPLVRYVIFASCIPLHCKRNIVINSLVAYARHSSTLDAFTTAAARLIGRLHHSYGYPLPFIRAALRLFYHRHGAHFLHLPPWGPRLLRTLLTRYLAALPPPLPPPSVRPPSLIAAFAGSQPVPARAPSTQPAPAAAPT